MLAGIAVAIATASSVAYCKTAEPRIAPLSMQLTRSGEALLNSHKAQAAIDQFETALAVDPKNTRAYIGIARSYDQLGLPGRAVKFYREALAIDPNDLTALSEQGEAYMARAYTYYKRKYVERAAAMTCKAAGLDPQGNLARLLSRGAYRIMKSRAERLSDKSDLAA